MSVKTSMSGGKFGGQSLYAFTCFATAVLMVGVSEIDNLGIISKNQRSTNVHAPTGPGHYQMSRINS